MCSEYGPVHEISVLTAYAVMQGCGNNMADGSAMVPFHSGQVRNFCLTSIKKLNAILYFILD